jgi:polysaccharide export outer membrane protein
MRLPPALATVALLFASSACKSSGGPPLTQIAAVINSTLRPVQVELAVGDEIAVRFPHSPDWDQTLQVAPDGSASFLGIGGLPVAGMTVEAVKSNLIKAYSYLMEQPDLTVVVTTVAARSVYVMGEVEDPGEFPLGDDRRLTLLEALARAGGPLKETAYLEHTLLVRWSPETGEQLSWKIDASQEHWTGPVPLYLQSYDVVFVPNTPIDDVGIWVDNYIRRLIPFPYITPAPR